MSETEQAAEQEPPVTKQAALRNAVSSKVSRLQGALLGDNPRTEARAKAVMSKLRNANAGAVTIDPEAWQIVLGVTGVGSKENRDEALPLALLGSRDSPNTYERAAYLTLTCYALHQQSQREPMHLSGRRFATAIGQLVFNTTPSVKTRFHGDRPPPQIAHHAVAR